MPRTSALKPLPLWKLCLIVVVSCGVAAAVHGAEISLLDGRTLEGEITAWQDGRLEIETADGNTSLPAEEVLRIRFAPAGERAPHPSVELEDGSELPLDHFTVKDGTAKIHVPHVAEPLEISTSKVAAVHLLPPTPTIAAQWKALRELEEPGDVIVIRKEDAIDHVVGRLGDVTDTHVHFHLDEDEYPADRAKVDGLVYYRAQKQDFPNPLCILQGDAGLKLVASSVRLDGDRLHVRTAAGIELAVAASHLEAADFSGGKVMYLSELTPRSTQTAPLVAFPASAEFAARTVEPVVDRGFFSPEAMLRHPRKDGEKVIGWELRPHARSLGLRSYSEITFQLPEGFTKLRALAGLDGTLGGRGNVHLSVFGNDRLLWEQVVDGTDAPATIELDIADVRRLRIVVDYGSGGDVADRLYLCEARITK